MMHNVVFCNSLKQWDKPLYSSWNHFTYKIWSIIFAEENDRKRVSFKVSKIHAKGVKPYHMASTS